MNRGKLNRRALLAWGVAGSVGAGIPLSTGRRVWGQGDERTPVVDCHLHCFAGSDDSRFPYHPRAPYRPQAAATPQHLLQCMNWAGVDRAIVVHPEPYQDDHRYLEYCLDIGQGRLKGTTLFFADRPQSLASMPSFLRRHEGKIIATRLHAYAPDRLPPFGSQELRQLWKNAAEAGIAMQVHLEPRYAGQIDSYVREFRDVRVIIDHLGRPMQGTPDEHATVLGWSELDNTIMKFSAIPAQTSYPHRDVRPILQRLSELWGEDRLLYGGGFGASATGESYRSYREDLLELLPDLSETGKAKLLGGNAVRLFGFQDV